MRSLFGFAVVAFFSVSVQASVVYDNGNASSSANNASMQMVADDFKLTQDSTITGAGFYAIGDYGSSTPWDGAIDYAIFQGGDNKPGVLIASGAGESISRDIAWDWDYPYAPQYRFDFLFKDPISIKANTVYWFGAHVGLGYENIYWYWNFTDSNNGASSIGSYQGAMNNWEGYYQGDRAFYLTGSAVKTTVPEPAIGGMVLVAGLVLLIWGKSRSANAS